MFVDGELAAIFTLIEDDLRDWPSVAVAPPVLWLRALAVDPRYRGHQLGTYAIDAARRAAGPDTWLYLDCVSDFLPDYYARHGFEFMARQVRAFPDGDYDITLMRQRGTAAP